jgi:hypothetical protein
MTFVVADADADANYADHAVDAVVCLLMRVFLFETSIIISER